MRKIQITLHPETRKMGVVRSFTNEREDDYADKTLSREFSVFNKAYAFAKPYARHRIPKTLKAIGKNGSFRVGMLADIYRFVEEDHGGSGKFTFEVSEEFRRMYEPSFPLPPTYKLHDFTQYGFPDYRDVQSDAIHAVFRRGRGIVEVGTAGGKGLVIASIIKTLQDYNPTLTFIVIVPTHLVLKTVEEFQKDYGVDGITGWGGGLSPDFAKRILVVGTHILGSKAEEHRLDIDRNVCLIDECHMLKHGSKITKVVEKYINTPNILGFTATISREEMDRWQCIGTIGKVVFEVPSQALKERGFKASSRVVSIKITGHQTKRMEYEDEQVYLLGMEERNRLIARFVGRICRKNTLIPVEFDEHQKMLVDLLHEETDREIWVIDGSVSSEERLRMYDEMENRDDIILVAKVGCMGAGISIKNLHYMAMPLIKKSFIRLNQLIGRTERLSANKTEAIILDFYDDLPYSTKHHKERCDIYNGEGIPNEERTIDIRRAVFNNQHDKRK